MKKRMIALLLAFAMLISVAPAAIADDTVPRPTVEEILSEYHQKAFEAEVVQQTGHASANSRSAGGFGKTLEQETVDTLNAAGYEAYNLTSENYETLEAQLQTDFADMGLDPDGSYIITISGEENSAGNNSRLGGNLVVPTLPPEGGGPSTYFEYTYNGTTYTMRYMTVTAKHVKELGRTKVVDLFADYSGEHLINALNTPVEIFTSFTDAFGLPNVVGIPYTLLSMVSSEAPLNQTASLSFTGSANWTVKYTQIWDWQSASWKIRSSIEFVNKTYSTTYSYYSEQENKYVYKYQSGDLPTEYSPYYYDTEAVKEFAVLALLYSDEARYQNKIPSVTIDYNGATVMTLTRWSEGLSYQP